ncbi:flippase-like domain-containing protein [bacterium]|nr:flippase-like domain-containing protein [bacterium]MBU1675326.1 flippase-like domain-containing protein [bacterium]
MNRRAFGAVLKLAISALLVWFLFRFRDVSSTSLLDVVDDPDWGLLGLAVLVFSASALAGAAQWGWILRVAGLGTPWLEMGRLYFVGMFFNNFLLGNVGGDAVKVYDLGRRAGSTVKVFCGTALDRLVGLCALTVLALMAFGVAAAGGLALPPVAALVLALVVWSGGLAVLLSGRVSSLVSRALARLPWPAVGERFAQFVAEFRLYRRRPAWLARVFLLALGVQALRVTTHVLIVAALGIALDGARILQLFVLVPLLGILIALPVSLNGLGLREVAAAELFVTAGVVAADSQAVAVEFLAYLAQVLVSLAGGVFFMLGPVRAAGRDAPTGE